jgi:hypothetical protein
VVAGADGTVGLGHGRRIGDRKSRRHRRRRAGSKPADRAFLSLGIVFISLRIVFIA